MAQKNYRLQSADSRDWKSELRKCLQSAIDLAVRLDI